MRLVESGVKGIDMLGAQRRIEARRRAKRIMSGLSPKRLNVALTRHMDTDQAKQISRQTWCVSCCRTASTPPSQQPWRHHRRGLRQELLELHDLRLAQRITPSQGIADALNARGIRTARGCRWYASTVRNLLVRADQVEGVKDAA